MDEEKAVRKIGIVGGLGPESTLEYYRGIISAFNRQGGGYEYPEIIIYSMNLGDVLAMFDSEDWGRLAGSLLEALTALHRAGAEFAAIASNTPHIVWDRIQPSSSLPLVSIVETVCREAIRTGVKRPALLGTSLTMRADYYHRRLSRDGIEAVSPKPEEQALVQHLLDTEIEKGVFKDETRDRLLAIVNRMRAEDGIDSAILGCTELPLILPEPEYGVPFLNTTNLHISAIVERCQRQG
jgi:aspartate racemase